MYDDFRESASGEGDNRRLRRERFENYARGSLGPERRHDKHVQAREYRSDVIRPARDSTGSPRASCSSRE